MRKRNNSNVFTSTNSLKVLSCLSENPGKQLLGSEIQKATSISRAGVYFALRGLTKKKLVSKTKKGKFLIYSVAYNDPVVKQFKVLKNIIYLRPLINRLTSFSKKIVLYGSASRGEDDSKSDIDLFILTQNQEGVKRMLPKTRLKRKIQTVVKSPSEWSEFKGKEKTFYEEVNRGITLWEG